MDLLGTKIIPRRVGPWPFPKSNKPRLDSFDEVQISYSTEEAIEEANRCILCPVPACVKACPVNLDVLNMMRNIQEHNFEEALRGIRETNCLPGSTGRICPQLDDLCEAHCVLNKRGDPLSIGMLQRFVSDWGEKKGLYENPVTQQQTGNSVAIIGGGPAGLAAADLLVQYGHKVTIFDNHKKLGGTARHGIPNFHLPKKTIDFEIEQIKKMGVEIRSEITVGEQLSIEELFEEGFHAILIAVGAKNVMPFKVDGVDLKGIYDAYEFLIKLDKMELYQSPDKITPFKIGERVLVIGGGDTAIDSARTVARLGAKEVTIMYRRSAKEMTAYHFGRELAEEEGIKIEYLQTPIRFRGDEKGWVKKAECIRMKLGDPDSSGRASPIPIEGSNFIMDIDTVFTAIGRGPNTFLQEKENIKMEKWGGIIINTETHETSYRGVFAAGDVVNGETLVVKAMRESRKAAQRIHEYLTKSDTKIDLFKKYFDDRYLRKTK